MVAIGIVQKCSVCGWSGMVRMYNIGDGPEWCCPSCDMCFCPTAVVGEDGLTGAEREMVREARDAGAAEGAVHVADIRMK